MSPELHNKINFSYDALRLAAEYSEKQYKKPLLLTYSGGKDSDVLLQLALESGINFEICNSHTTVDAPETVYHIREVFNTLKGKGYNAYTIQSHQKDGKPITMWNLIPRKLMPPTRIARQCCQYLKETSAKNRYIATGVRADESPSRATRSVFETVAPRREESIKYSYGQAKKVFQEEDTECILIKRAKQNKKLVVNPIFDWTYEDVWIQINNRKIKQNPLYDQGFNRIGCLMCPMATPAEKRLEAKIYPVYYKNYLSAFKRMLENNKQRDTTKKSKWETAQDVMDWWLERDIFEQSNLNRQKKKQLKQMIKEHPEKFVQKSERNLLKGLCKTCMKWHRCEEAKRFLDITKCSEYKIHGNKVKYLERIGNRTNEATL